MSVVQIPCATIVNLEHVESSFYFLSFNQDMIVCMHRCHHTTLRNIPQQNHFDKPNKNSIAMWCQMQLTWTWQSEYSIPCPNTRAKKLAKRSPWIMQDMVWDILHWYLIQTTLYLSGMLQDYHPSMPKMLSNANHYEKIVQCQSELANIAPLLQ